jgi:hypothetical protein
MRTTHGAILIDDARWPLVDVHFIGTVSTEDYRSAFARYAELAKRGDKIVWLIDMRRFDPLSVDASTRRAAADVFAEHRDALMSVSIAEARIIESFVTRNVLTAFDWLTGGNKWPCEQFATHHGAETWLRDRYAHRVGQALRMTGS